MSANPLPTVQIAEVTCGHCGHQRHFAAEAINAVQLAVVDSRRCNQCGEAGASVALMAYHLPLPFVPEVLPLHQALQDR